MSSIFAMNFEEIRILEYFDFPILTHCRAADQNYIVVWCDFDDDTEYWYCVAVSNHDLDGYLFGYLSLLDVFKRSPEIYSCVDAFVDEENCAHGTLIQFSAIPKEKLPTKDSFFQEPI